MFLDVFQMCHKFDFKGRMGLEAKTLPISDLLLTKLQIVEVNEKDIKDLCAMLLDHEISPEESPEKINSTYIAKLCAEDWGIYKTLTTSLTRLQGQLEGIGLDEGQRRIVFERAEALRKAVEARPKSMGWKMRASVGEKKRWYELPEADHEVVDSGP